MVILETERLRVRTLEEDDKPLLVTWLTNPVVLAFYEGRDNPHDREKVDQHFYDRNVTANGKKAWRFCQAFLLCCVLRANRTAVPFP
ncbi:GNAT family N-acetyltransferase [Brevibacillus thermoruber]|uniref:GNAT family N-acetyltransferase n=1 Tax=Brevibacillus thermoruber TaxID=33942 RepID=UPI0040426715